MPINFAPPEAAKGGSERARVCGNQSQRQKRRNDQPFVTKIAKI
jgi:hypothetical protein